MKRMFLSAFALVACFMGLQAQTQVIAHRGFWKTEGSAQNSITALEKAAEEKLYGSEFDVQVTLDGKLIVNHDAKFQGRDNGRPRGPASRFPTRRPGRWSGRNRPG